MKWRIYTNFCFLGVEKIPVSFTDTFDFQHATLYSKERTTVISILSTIAILYLVILVVYFEIVNQ